MATATKARVKRLPKGGEPAVEKENVDVSPVKNPAKKNTIKLSLQEELESVTRAFKQKLRKRDREADEEKKRLKEKVRKLQRFQPTLEELVRAIHHISAEMEALVNAFKQVSPEMEENDASLGESEEEIEEDVPREKCPQNCGKTYSGKTSAFYFHKSKCQGRVENC